MFEFREAPAARTKLLRTPCDKETGLGVSRGPKAPAIEASIRLRIKYFNALNLSSIRRFSESRTIDIDQVTWRDLPRCTNPLFNRHFLKPSIYEGLTDAVLTRPNSPYRARMPYLRIELLAGKQRSAVGPHTQ